jgi:hypothetical protein
MPPRYPHGPLAAGVVRTEDVGDDPALVEAIGAAGGMWQAGDYYADPATIVATARANGVRALRVDARDLSFLSELPELEVLHLRSDGRAVLDPVASLPNLRALLIEHDALRGKIRLDAHPRLAYLRIKLSGRGGRENLPGFLAGHPGVRHLHISEVPFGSLDEVAEPFPALRTLSIFGGERMRSIGDVSSWADTLERLRLTFVRLRAYDGIESLRSLGFLGATFTRVRTIAPLADLRSLTHLSILGSLPSLSPLVGRAGVRIARLTMPDDQDLSPLATWPHLVGLIGEQWLGRDVPVPYLEHLPHGHPLHAEWIAASGSSLTYAL